ncbi:hypothetical protein EIP91_011447 [Steccherinum ochraceum]|uniref:Snurportin-1 n=1 Tax=Steccherinum ochraceum TaxID=92696 RepID=A0A4R0RRT7_9APHY|nr:hypothetical protein EIP91_011447 [Steccherinum ochraceum]
MFPSRPSTSDRKSSYKATPGSIRDASSSQEYRRQKALEEQKRRRAERFDSSRQLDFFANLTLGPSDDEDDTGDGPDVVREGISSFVPLITSEANTPANGAAALIAPVPVDAEVYGSEQPSGSGASQKKKGKGKRKGKGKGRAKADSGPQVPGKWGDKCMYAELLEMNEDFDLVKSDGIPEDIETGWVAVAPVPVGKRCLAITHAASGIAGIVPNTTLRSRLLGKPLMKPFPSSLPPHTVLDCILDDGWRNNGILHILDIIKWKGQDIGDCETPFRFWWRDTRLSELSVSPPPASASDSQQANPTSPYQFSYPTTLVAVPCHTDTTLQNISNVLIPLTRHPRRVSITLPVPTSSTMMEMEDSSSAALQQVQSVSTEIRSDGLLLYVSQSTYEPGTSPLSTWVPIRPYADSNPHGKAPVGVEEGPLDQFERLINRRLAGRAGGLQMDMS